MRSAAAPRAARGGASSPAGGPQRLSMWKLASAFRDEQRDPDRFYRLLAADTAALVGETLERHRGRPLAGTRVVDVGSGPGDLAEAFRDAGADAVACDVDFDEMHVRPRALAQAVVADGTRLPFDDATFDVACASNVLEHVPDPLALVQELGRVARPSGVVFVNYTLWRSPWGGHETSPWHYLGGATAVRRYERRRGQSPKNRFGTTLFPLAGTPFVAQLARLDRLRVVDWFPRYLPRWCRPVARLPVLGDVVAWNLAVVLERRDDPRATGDR